jgi:methionine synthase II (cobalamin-independent)
MKMGMLTTTIGAYPKPGHVPTLDSGLGVLDRATARAKLANTVAAARSVGS